MCAEFGEVTVIIGLVINFLAFRLTIRISWHLNISPQKQNITRGTTDPEQWHIKSSYLSS